MRSQFFVILFFCLSIISLKARETFFANETFEIFSDGVYEKNYQAQIVSSSLVSEYYHSEQKREIPAPSVHFPRLATSYPIIDGLYKLALHEAELNINKDGFFVAGAKWQQAWTRDMSYAIDLSFAAIFNSVSWKSLETRIFEDTILQDTGTGGAYPISTDRVTWVIAAYQVALHSQSPQILTRVYELSSRVLREHLHLVFNEELGLFKGEQSFLDWREQTYPMWMAPDDIGISYALGTNVVHYQALEALCSMATQLGKADDFEFWDKFRTQVRTGIRKNFYSNTHKYFRAYRIDGIFPFEYDGYENLGNSLALLNDLFADLQMGFPEVSPYGMPVVAPQLAGILPYHNNALWPFVQSYRGLAHAYMGDMKGFEEEFFGIIRSAALFMTFKENLVATTGSPETQLNSDRQLWSVAGYLGMIYRGLFGINLDKNGVHFLPIKPKVIKNDIQLDNYKIAGMTMNLHVKGTGTKLTRLNINGKDYPTDYKLPIDSTGIVSVIMVLDEAPQPHISTSYKSTAFIQPVETLSLYNYKGKQYLEWRGDASAVYDVYANGALLASVTGLDYVMPIDKLSREYFVLPHSELPLLKGKPVWSEPLREIIIAEAELGNFTTGIWEKPTKKGKADYTKNSKKTEDFKRLKSNGAGYLAKWGDSVDAICEVKLKAKTAGEYQLQIRYTNGGPVNTGEKCSIKELYVNDEFVEYIYLPHTGSWIEWKFTTPLKITLNKGVNNIRLENSSSTVSQRNVFPVVNLDLFRAIKIRNF